MVLPLFSVVLTMFQRYLRQINQVVEIFLGAVAQVMQKILTKAS
ncbi:hypothetical protein [Bartonella rattimassiliensis]|nr:hypothetical protein [Bartonella rattimassiliensis]